MGHITITETINAPVATVFGYVDDHRNTTKYMQGLTKWQPTTSVTHGKGAKFEVSMKAGPANLGSVVDITTWQENRAIGWRSLEGFKQAGMWAFKAKSERATEVTFDMEYELGGGLAGRMLSRAAEPVVRSNLQRSVHTLKQHAERLAQRAPAASANASPKAGAKSPAKGAAPAPKAPAASTTTPAKSGAKSTAKAPAKSAAKSSAKSAAKRGR